MGGSLHSMSETLRDRALGDSVGACLGEHLGPGASSNSSMILAYHEISAQPSNYIYAVSVRQFEEHLRMSSELCGGEQAKIPVPVVTFDDGHISNYRYALPLLAKYSRRAIFFVTVGWAGVRDEFMNWSQLRHLVMLGHGVASHGWSHIPLTRCTPAEAREELRRSKLTLEDKLGIAAEDVSFPHGRWDRSVLGLCADLGYRRVYTSNPWVPLRKQDGVELLGRLMMRRTICAAQFRRLLTLGRTGRAIRRAEYEAKEVLRRILGDKTYHRLWGLMAGRYDPDAMK